MASNCSDCLIDEDNRVSKVFPWICRGKNHSNKRTRIVESHYVCMVARHCARRNIWRTTHHFGAVGKTIGYGTIYCIGSNVLLCLLLGFLLGSFGANTRDRISMATTRNWSLERVGSTILEHGNLVDIRSLSNVGTS